MECATQREPSDSGAVATRRHVAFVAGGTAGHVYPALAVAAAYRRAVPSVCTLFVGAGAGFESHLVAAHGYRLESIAGAPLFGVGLAGKALAVGRLLAGIGRASRLLQAEGIQLVFGFGGYVSASTILAARSLGLSTAILELNAQPGLTNRLLGRIVDRVYLGSAAARPVFAGAKTVVTGVPVRPEVAGGGPARRAGPDSEHRFHILVTGGSLGSAFLNQHAAELLGRLAAYGVALGVLHQAGARDLEAVRRAYASVGLAVRVASYLEDMGDAYAWAHFAIACAGAGTLAELATTGLPALIVPLGAASEDHQTANARTFAAASGSAFVQEQDWDPARLAAQILEVLTHPDAWAAASERVRRLATPAAAAAVVADCEAMLAARR